MSLHRLASIAIGAPHLDSLRAFYRDFGLDETAHRNRTQIHNRESFVDFEGFDGIAVKRNRKPSSSASTEYPECPL